MTAAIESTFILHVFPSDLGWMALVMSGEAVRRLTFGHTSAAAARQTIPREISDRAVPGNAQVALVRRLQAYAAGAFDEFQDVSIDFGRASEFQRSVLERCRLIPYGKTLTYAELAEVAGSPLAVRAVGNCMAANQVPLLVPCHRVVRTGGGFGCYSAPGGAPMKHRLLELEAKTAGFKDLA